MDCEVVLDDHSQERRIDRGLPFVDLVRMVREGDWQARPDGLHDIAYGKWTIRVKLGRCLIGVATVIPER